MLTTYHYVHSGVSDDSGICAVPGTIGVTFEETRTLAKRLHEANVVGERVLISAGVVDIHGLVLGDDKLAKGELMKRARRVYGGI